MRITLVILLSFAVAACSSFDMSRARIDAALYMRDDSTACVGISVSDSVTGIRIPAEKCFAIRFPWLDSLRRDSMR